jgi:hypothetical protein
MGPGDRELASMGADARLRRVLALPRRVLRLSASTAWHANARSRTDPDAPDYPDYDAPSGPTHSIEVSPEDRRAAERLLQLLGAYEHELRSAGKSPKTVFTYVDRAERFLRRVASG